MSDSLLAISNKLDYPSLQQLELNSCHAISDAGVSELVKCTNKLTEFQAEWTCVGVCTALGPPVSAVVSRGSHTVAAGTFGRHSEDTRHGMPRCDR